MFEEPVHWTSSVIQVVPPELRTRVGSGSLVRKRRDRRYAQSPY